MIILLENARHWYDICCKKIEYKKTGRVLIFLSQTIDSLTSLRILVSLFQTDIIPYEIIPIENYNELADKLNQKKLSSIPLLGIVIINCLGDNDLTKFWFYEETGNEVTCLVVDSRRPCNHRNINDNKKIIIINDDLHNLAFCPTNQEMDEILNDNDDEDEDGECYYGDEVKRDKANDENDNENENANGTKVEVKKKIKKKKKDLDINTEDVIEKDLDKDDWEADEHEEDNIDQIANSVKKGKEKVNEKQSAHDEKRRKRLMNRRKIEEYYSGSYYGYPSTYIFYSIASQLHREEIKFLWYLIVAVTDEYLRAHFSQKQYDILYKICHDEVLKLAKKKKQSLTNDNQSRYKSTGKDVNTIVIESDYRLYLYRHWNLFDSFVYSYYPLGKFSAWREQGKEDIKKIFTVLGLPLAEATQKYRYMKSEFKATFKNNIIDISNKFELTKLLFLSFVYQFDKNTELSASDCVYLLSALLEYPFDEIDDINIEDDDRYIEYDSDKTKNDDDVNEKDKSATSKETKLKRFWYAYSFLSLKKLNMTNGLIDLAIKFQIALANMATSIIDKKTFADVKSFRYTVINSNITQESHYFHLPGNLELLSLFVMELFKLTHSKRTNKPLLIAILNAEEKTYLIKGNLGCNRETDDQRNEFGIKFKYVAKKTGIKVRYDYNNDDLITISKDDLFAFIQEISAI